MLLYSIPALKIGAPVTADQHRLAREQAVASQVADAAWDMAGWGNEGDGFSAEMQDFMVLQRCSTTCSCISSALHKLKLCFSSRDKYSATC